jgi:hypothetical protein
MHFCPLVEWRKTQVGGTDRKSLIHADNAHSHPAKKCLDFPEQNGMRKAPPPYSADLAPSDFCLFAHVKQLLAGHKFPDRGALLGPV